MKKIDIYKNRKYKIVEMIEFIQNACSFLEYIVS